MSNNILFVGDINIDLILGGLQYPVQEDREIMAESFIRTMGSSSVITAVAYRSLGGRAEVCGLVGNDDNGTYMLNLLDKYKIGRTLVTVDRETSTGVTVNLIYRKIRSQVTYPGTIPLFKGPVLTGEFSEYRHVHFSGIYQQKAFLPNIVSTMEYLKELGVSISLDTQWDITEKWEYLNKIYPYLDFLFINRDEALSISGGKDFLSVLDYFKDKTACTLIKLGSEGSYVLKNGIKMLIPPYPSNVVDTTGAGDSFAGGFFHAHYNKHLEINEAAHYASAASAISCGFAGGVGARLTDIDIQKKLMEGKNV